MIRRALLLATLASSLVWLVLALALAQDDSAEANAKTSDVAAAQASAKPSTEELPIIETELPPTDAAPEQAAADELPSTVAEPAPSCEVGDEPAPAAELNLWRYTVLDTRFRLPPDYHPDDLVEIVDLLADVVAGDVSAVAQPGQKVRAVMSDDLKALFAAAESAGQLLAVQSAFRSFNYQESTFSYWVDLNGYPAALATSARAGHSEHQLGTTIDFRSRHGPAAWDVTDWAETSEGAYLAENAWRYGFVMSYPKGAEDESCYDYEPWHYRYLGRDLAAQVHASGLTPRTFLWRLAQEFDEPSTSSR